MRGAIYSRVSTIHQEYKRQTAELKDFARNNDIEIIKIYEEKESGFWNDRPKFKELCELTKDEIDIILVYELSRLSRKAIFLQKNIEDFTRKGINIYALKEKKYTLTPDGTPDPNTQLIIAFISTFAQQEAATFKARCMAGNDYKIIKKGEPSIRHDMYGYVYDKKTRTLQIEEKGAKMVRLIFNLSLKGKPIKEICMILNSKGYKPMKSKNNMIEKHTVSDILSREIYCGTYYYKGHRLQSPPIISKQTFEKCKKKDLKKKKR